VVDGHLIVQDVVAQCVCFQHSHSSSHPFSLLYVFMCNLRSRLGILARYIRSCSTLQNFMCIMSYVSAAPSRARMAVGFPFERHRDGRVHSFCPWSRSRSSTGTMSALPSCERLPADSGVRGQAYYHRRASRIGLFAIVSLVLHILRAICSFQLLSMSLNGAVYFNDAGELGLTYVSPNYNFTAKVCPP